MHIDRHKVPFSKKIIWLYQEGISIKIKTGLKFQNRKFFERTKNQPPSRQTPTLATSAVTACPWISAAN